jgi:hypothetical protein
MASNEYSRDWYQKNKELVKLQKRVCHGCGRPKNRGRRCDDWAICLDKYQQEIAAKKKPTPQPMPQTPGTSARNPLHFRMVTDDGVCPADALFYIADALLDISKELKTLNSNLQEIKAQKQWSSVK